MLSARTLTKEDDDDSDGGDENDNLGDKIKPVNDNDDNNDNCYWMVIVLKYSGSKNSDKVGVGGGDDKKT